MPRLRMQMKQCEALGEVSANREYTVGMRYGSCSKAARKFKELPESFEQDAGARGLALVIGARQRMMLGVDLVQLLRKSCQQKLCKLSLLALDSQSALQVLLRAAKSLKDRGDHLVDGVALNGWF